MSSAPHHRFSHASECSHSDFICFSHLRWNFVYQRPQHLISRFARHRRVFYVEDPVFAAVKKPELRLERPEAGLLVATPRLPEGISPVAATAAQRRLLDQLMGEEVIRRFTAWYYTPMALAFSAHLTPDWVIYDCMDELSAFKFAPPEIKAFEAELMRRADLVLTGGQSLYEAKRHLHPNIHPFPSSIDAGHFGSARSGLGDPDDQRPITRPRLGFFGVLDERLDLDLLAAIADARPAWQLVILGPVVKISPSSLPLRPNIHYLGQKDYRDLPRYLAGWDVALLPFARNQSTRFISPTKTPEYLAAGKPVVSTPIRDVVRPYGEAGLVAIADGPGEFIACVERALEPAAAGTQWLRRVDEFLAGNSWDSTWRRVALLERQLSYRERDAHYMGIHPNTMSTNVW